MTRPSETTNTRIFKETAKDSSVRIFLLCAVAAIAAFGFWASFDLPMFVRLLGLASVGVVLAICFHEAIKLIAGRHRVLKLSPQGFTDTNIAPETVPWTSVERLSIVSPNFLSSQRNIAVQVHINGAGWERLTLTRGAKINRSQTGGMWIMHPGRQSEFSSFVDTVRSYALANGGKVD
ncbi:MAG: hypothetical protein ABS58_15515 [Mesorhizobium sp. SCN 65-20]|nr:MAG: hypothetical protein ABS58_15515 [Mesorhizobium sp. SCN 65-20]